MDYTYGRISLRGRVDEMKQSSEERTGERLLDPFPFLRVSNSLTLPVPLKETFLEIEIVFFKFLDYVLCYCSTLFD